MDRGVGLWKNLAKQACTPSLLAKSKRKRSSKHRAFARQQRSMFQLRTNPLTGETEWVVVPDDSSSTSSSKDDGDHALAYTSYLDMLNDSSRNHAYYLAIRKAITRPCHVLDIGAGTGLLSMMSYQSMNERASDTHDSKQEGQITACESYLPMLKLARKVFSSNGLKDKIRLIHKRSDDLQIGVDMPCQADILVSEILDSELLGEGLIPTLQHAHDHLLSPNVQTIPYKAIIYGQLVESESFWKMSDLHGIESLHSDNLSLCPSTSVDILKRSQHAIHCEAFQSEINLLSEPFKVFDIDLWQKPEDVKDVEVNVNAISPGRAHAIISWWVLQLDMAGTIFYSTAPNWIMSKYRDTESAIKFIGGYEWCDHWKQCVWFIPDGGLSISAADEVKVHAYHDAISFCYDVRKKPIPLIRQCKEPNLCMTPGRIALLGDREWRSALLSTGEKMLQGKESALCLVTDDSLALTVIGASLSSSSNVISLLPGIGTSGFKYLCKVAEKNNFSVNKIKVLGKPAAELSPGDTSGRKVDILMAEPFYLANEGRLPWQNLRFWKERTVLKHLLSEDIEIIPSKGILQGCAVFLPDLWRSRQCVKDIKGFEHSAVNNILGACGDLPDIFDGPLLPYSISQCGKFEFLSEQFTLMEFDFYDEIQNVSGDTEVKFTTYGTCHAFVFWIDWVMDPQNSIILSMKPGPIPTHKQGVKLLKEPLTVQKFPQVPNEEFSQRENDTMQPVASVKLNSFFDASTGRLDVNLNLHKPFLHSF